MHAEPCRIGTELELDSMRAEMFGEDAMLRVQAAVKTVPTEIAVPGFAICIDIDAHLDWAAATFSWKSAAPCDQTSEWICPGDYFGLADKMRAVGEVVQMAQRLG